MNKFLKISVLASLAFACASTASAQIVVLGNGAASECYRTTKMGNQGSVGAIRTCTSALKTYLRRRDLAATHVNRGVLLMRKGKYEEARTDYERAIKLQPQLDQAYINYGATLFYLRENEAALAALNTAIDMDTDKMAEALYNRSLVYHEKQDYRAAYNDLKNALELKPEWVPAQQALGRYNVKRKAGA